MGCLEFGEVGSFPVLKPAPGSDECEQPGRLRTQPTGPLPDGGRLRTLARTWRCAIDDLHARGIAHGDLASDNCLVRSETDLTLIDYDGCFVKRLAHAHPGEFGHEDYQHPRRSGYYGPNMDAFPALVVYLSLLAVAAEPKLWDTYNDEDAKLILSERDYLNPGATALWRRLSASPDTEVRALADVLATMCTKPVESLPPLGTVLKHLEDRLPPLHVGVVPEIGDDMPDDLGWMDTPITAAARMAAPPADLDWIDHPMIGLEGRPRPPMTTVPSEPEVIPAPPAKRRNWLARTFRRLFRRSPLSHAAWN